MSKRGKIFQFRKAIHMNFTPFFFMVAQRATAFGWRGEGLAPGSGAIYSWLPGLTFPNEHHWAPQFHLPHLATLSLIHGRNQPLNFFFHPSVCVVYSSEQGQEQSLYFQWRRKSDGENLVKKTDSAITCGVRYILRCYSEDQPPPWWTPPF